MRRRLLFAAGIAGLAACADLFDDPTQCGSDGDCARFGEAVCDPAAHVCVRPGATPSEAGVPPAPPSDASTTPPPDAPSAETAPPDPCSGPKGSGVIGDALDADGRAEITGSVTLGCDKDWSLDRLVFVRSGATLTIAAGTTIRAKAGAGIIVSPGAKLVAQGTRNAPIVLTSAATAPSPGDWRGVFLLGLAPPAAQGPYADDPDLAWGGANEADGSGTLSFVRIEYAKSGLVLAGAGNGTKIDSVQVRRTVEPCFVFWGGTVDAKHLVCQSPGGDQFSFAVGYKGRTQFLFGQKTAAPPVFGANGLLVDDARPTLYNATFCGDTPTPNGYGIVFRDGATLDVNGVIVTGWFAGVDATGSLPSPGDIRSSIAFGNDTNPAYAETPDETDPDQPDYDDDNGFDEIAWLSAPERKNSVADPGLVGCFDPKAPKPWPATSLTTNAPSPPTDGFFDPKATFIGAFSDANDPWMTGTWVRFDDN